MGPVVSKALAWLGVYDLAAAPMIFAVWLGIGAADLRVLATLTLVRVVVMIVFVWRELSPVAACVDGGVGAPPVSDAQLREADRALQTLEYRLAGAHATGWVVCLMLSTLLAALAIPVAIPLGRLEIATAVVLATSIGSVFWQSRGLVRALVLPAHEQIAAQMLARKLAVDREPSSVGRGIRSTVGHVTLSTVPSLMALGGFLYVGGLRAEATMDQRHRAERAAERVRAGDDPESLDPDLRVITQAELPALLLHEADEGRSSRRAYDPAAREALAVAPIDEHHWLLARGELDERLGTVFGLVALFSVAALGITVFLANSLWQAQRALLDRVDQATRRLVEVGDIAAIERMPPLHDDEFGRIARSFNALLDMLDELARAAATVAKGDLSLRLERPGELHDAFRGMVEQLGRVVTPIRATSIDVAAAAAEIQAAMREQDRVGRQQSASVTALRAAVGSLTSAATNIADEASRVLSDAEQASAATRATSDELQALRQQVAGIVGLLESIREIADRSDLLALNGSLEATRVGEAGRGFSLVAAEMRRLAERVTAIVGEGRARLAEVESASRSTLAVNERSRELASSTAGAARRIAALIGDQERATIGVGETAGSVALAVEAVGQASHQTSEAAEGLGQQATQLERLTRHFAE